MSISPELISTVGLYAIVLAFPALPVFIAIGVVLHRTLIKRLDPLLFKKPYFQDRELIMYVTWPFSVLKTVGYIMLITFPKAAKWRRFKGFDKEAPVEKPLVALCYIEMVLMAVMALSWVVMMVAALVSWVLA